MHASQCRAHIQRVLLQLPLEHTGKENSTVFSVPSTLYNILGNLQVFLIIERKPIFFFANCLNTSFGCVTLIAMLSTILKYIYSPTINNNRVISDKKQRWKCLPNIAQWGRQTVRNQVQAVTPRSFQLFTHEGKSMWQWKRLLWHGPAHPILSPSENKAIMYDKSIRRESNTSLIQLPMMKTDRTQQV